MNIAKHFLICAIAILGGENGLEAMAQQKHRSMQIIELGGGLVTTEALAMRIAASYIEISRDVDVTGSAEITMSVERLEDRWLVQTRLPGGFSLNSMEPSDDNFVIEIAISDGRILRYEVTDAP